MLGILKSSYSKLIGANVLVQILSFLLIPIFSRLYLPEDFSILAQFLAVSSILLNFYTLKLEASLVICEKKDFNNILMTIVYWSLMCFVFNVLVVVVSFYFFDFHILGNDLDLLDSLLLPLYLVIQSLFVSYLFVYNSKGKFGRLSLFLVGNTFNKNAFRIIFSFFIRTRGLVLSLLSGSVSIFLILFSKRKELFFFNSILKSFSLSKMRHVFLKYKYYPLFHTPSCLFSYFTISLPIIIFSYFFTSEETGNFGIVTQILAVPISVVGDAIGKIIYKDYQDKENDNFDKHRINRKIRLIYFGTLVISTLGYFLVFLFFSNFLSFILGSKWLYVDSILFFLAPSIIFRLLLSEFSYIFNVIRKLNLEMYLNLLSFILIIGSLVYFTVLEEKDFLIVVKYLGILSVLGNYIIISVLFYYLKMKDIILWTIPFVILFIIFIYIY